MDFWLEKTWILRLAGWIVCCPGGKTREKWRRPCFSESTAALSTPPLSSCGGTARFVAVQPQVFDLLILLLENRHRLVTKEEIFQRIWKNRIVSDAALPAASRPSARHSATTGPSRVLSAPSVDAASASSPLWRRLPRRSPTLSVRHGRRRPTGRQEFVGRADELAVLQVALKKACVGSRQAVFVSGEPGIGKSTLVRTFLASAAAPVRAAVAHAQCIELYGESEPYLPIFEAMQRLGAEIGADKLASYLKSFAPTWLAQMPWLADASQPAASGAGATSQRMLRELAQVLEAMSAVRPIVLWVEDLHWSDLSTRDALSFLARRSDPARLLIIGSWRPAEAHARGHPVQAVKGAITLCNHCRELTLGFLGLGDVAVYLQRRFALEPAELAELSQFLHARTSGNALFVVTLADDLVRSGALRTNGTNWQLTRPVSEIGLTIPDTIQILIGQQIESLAAEERRVLQIAAVSGAESPPRRSPQRRGRRPGG